MCTPNALYTFNGTHFRFFQTVSNMNEHSTKNPSDSLRQNEVLIQNAFYLLANKEYILSDPRMFMAPSCLGVPHACGPICLKALLEWWSEKKYLTDSGERVLIHHMTGSPISGSNISIGVNSSGDSYKILRILGFVSTLITLTKKSSSLREEFPEVEAYAVSDIVDLLKRDPETFVRYDKFLQELEALE